MSLLLAHGFCSGSPHVYEPAPDHQPWSGSLLGAVDYLCAEPLLRLVEHVQ